MTAARVELVLVDFDDTLVVTEPRFRNARRDLFARLATAGFTEDLARRVHEAEVEPEMLVQYGLGPHRLEHSFRATYERLCAQHGLAPDAHVAEECAAFGRTVAGTPDAIEGALDALSRLAEAYPTIVYTQSGDPDYQIECVRAAGVTDVITHERVRVTTRKTTDELRNTLAHYGVMDAANAWMVGNSMRSDVNPALAAGARAILVEAGTTWVHEHEEPLSDDFVRMPSFMDAVDFLLGLGHTHDTTL